MKKIIFCFITTVLFLSSCQKNKDIKESFEDEVLLTKTNSEISIEEFGADDFIVSPNELDSYIAFMKGTKERWRNNNSVEEIIPKYGESRDCPAFYVIQYKEGWEAISSDKRGPIVLARSETGKYSDMEKIEAACDWMKELADEIIYRRTDKEHFNNQDKNALSNEIQSVEFWKMITSDTEYINSKRVYTKINDMPTTYEGYWEIDHQYGQTIEDSNIPHMIDTRWHQEAPFNYYAPWRSDSSGLRAPAGCVAIAGAQMLYYLHYYLGAPLYASTTATCTGNVNAYSINVTGSSSTIWDSMTQVSYYSYNDVTAYDPSAVLIAWVGVRVNMDYGNNASGANTMDLVDEVFAIEGINTQHGDYNKTKVLNSLKQGLPVVARGNSHAFIIDGYRSTIYKHTVVYRWMQYDGVSSYIPTDEYMTEISYGSPVLSYVRINWGWGPAYDNIEYAESGAWSVGGTNFAHNRKIIYNFTINQ